MRRHLFLFPTLACFFGLIAIFFVDGYMGIHDTLYVTVEEHEQQIEFSGQRQNLETVHVNWGEKVKFRHKVDNSQFSSYTTDVEVSVSHNEKKVHDLTTKPLSVDGFESGQLEWVIDSKELLPESIPPEQGRAYTVLFKRGDIEREIIIYINPPTYPAKPVPALPR